jgi:aryl-alcohol dehydrogenase-like predicted oxidoreductase
LRQPLIDATLTGAKSVQELAQNLAAIHDPLPEQVWTEIETLDLTG